MQIIKLNATSSTNEYFKQMLSVNSIEDFTVVVTDNQTNGRGQMGTKWISESGKNLTFSVLKNDLNLDALQQFKLNIAVSIALYDALQTFNIPNLYIKWPNDILSANHKICGVLIENILVGSRIQQSIIGIGLNVNQILFDNLPNVSSLKLLLGKNFDLDALLEEILFHLKKYVTNDFLHADKSINLYTEKLFRLDKPSTFKNENDELFMGFIKGISPYGKLKVMLEDEILKEFDLKEIKLLY